MLDISQAISDFLRDATWRIAEIGTELDQMKSKSDPRYKTLESHRLQLYQFMDVLYIGRWSFKDAGTFNFMFSTNSLWTDREILEEIEFLRALTQMNNAPWIEFVGSNPQLVNIVNEDTGNIDLPAGTPNDFIYYNQNSNPATLQFPQVAGFADTDKIGDYFT